MAVTSSGLPQLSGEIFLTDGGLETTLIFHEELDLPHFAAFHLMRQPEGRETLRGYFRRYATIARDRGMGFILESATWRASPDWGEQLGYSTEQLVSVNKECIRMLEEIRREFDDGRTKIVISGCMGPRGDGYDPDELMTVDDARRYHGLQARAFAEAGADLVTAITMTHSEEAAGIAHAAADVGLPVAISFTVETDGTLPSGGTLRDAIEEVDAATNGSVAYYMVNCAHTSHFAHVLDAGEPWVDRIRGLRPNASTKSHAELDEAEELDDGDPVRFGADCAALRARLGNLNVLGGCCGTDHRHISELANACATGNE